MRVNIFRHFTFFIELVRCYFYDLWRYHRHSGICYSCEDRILTDIIGTYHVIEKGLSHYEMRYGFGQDKILKLLDLLSRYEKQGGDIRDCQYISACNVLKAYIDYHQSNKKVQCENLNGILDRISFFLNSINALNSSVYKGGFREINKDEYLKSAKGDFVELSQNRYSIRTFKPGNISIQKIRNAVHLAQKSPSTCNRQTARVYVFSDRQKIKEILAVHKGTRGFTEQIDKLLLIAGDLRSCLGRGDRNQAFVDCGIFSMNILYSLQYHELGACILHWNVSPRKDRRMRKITNIAANHTIVCLVATGELMETFKVPFSQRKKLEDILIEH